MKPREPKDTKEIHWTMHIKDKMRFYNLSESRLRRLLRNPQRIEKGIAPKTIAVMQSAKAKGKNEIWLMYQLVAKKPSINLPRIRMISAWRYPGKSPAGKPPIPEDILQEIKKLIENPE